MAIAKKKSFRDIQKRNMQICNFLNLFQT